MISTTRKQDIINNVPVKSETYELQRELDAYENHVCIDPSQLIPLMFLAFVLGCVAGRIIKRVI